MNDDTEQAVQDLIDRLTTGDLSDDSAALELSAALHNARAKWLREHSSRRA